MTRSSFVFYNFPVLKNHIKKIKNVDIGISSNLIGLLSLTNGQCPYSWEVDNEVTENDIVRMQDITIRNYDNSKISNKTGIISILVM